MFRFVLHSTPSSDLFEIAFGCAVAIASLLTPFALPVSLAQDVKPTVASSAEPFNASSDKTDNLEELVLTGEGSIPILISAPHGGTLGLPGVAPREGKGLKTGASGFFVGRDGGTQELALAVAQAIEEEFGEKPYFVVSATHRKYLDPNRPASIALEDQAMQPVYDRYHQTMAKFTTQILNKHQQGLLLDLHGQGSKRDTVFRGTNNGKTVSRLIREFGKTAHEGEQSFFGILKSTGWTVHPDPFGGKEQSGFTGGYIVQTYGSHQAAGIDAMQLEMGAIYRTKESRERIARELAKAIAQYSNLYLPKWIPTKTKLQNANP
jgi:N-formylglutamate amidohydrolase